MTKKLTNDTISQIRRQPKGIGPQNAEARPELRAVTRHSRGPRGTGDEGGASTADVAPHVASGMKSEADTPQNGDRRTSYGTAPHLHLGKPAAGKNSRPVGSTPLVQQMPGIHHIELNLRDLEQLFNTMDPSPFHEKDLDDDAAEFILSWAQEFHRHEAIDLIVHLEKQPDGHNAQQLVESAVHNYFAYRARLNKLEFKRLMKQGRMSLLVGVSFLGACFFLIELLVLKNPTAFPNFFKEGVTIAGWVAMWRPLEIYLYEWWPLRRRGQIFDKLSRMPVEARHRT